MAKQIDKHSDTWRAVEAFAKAHRDDAIEALIADRFSEQQRGKIEILDDLLRLPYPSTTPVIEPE